MRYLIVCRRRLGVALDQAQLRKAEPVRGDVHIMEIHDKTLGRSTTSAFIFKPSPHMPDLLPRLLDVKVTGMASNGMNLTGVEDIDGALYSQSWWCRLE